MASEEQTEAKAQSRVTAQYQPTLLNVNDCNAKLEKEGSDQWPRSKVQQALYWL